MIHDFRILICSVSMEDDLKAKSSGIHWSENKNIFFAGKKKKMSLFDPSIEMRQ